MLICRLKFNSGDNYYTPAKTCEREEFTNFWGDYSLRRLFVEGRKRLPAGVLAGQLMRVLGSLRHIIL